MEGEFIKLGKNLVSTKEFLAEGHNFCTGCGEALAIRLTCKALGENTIIAMATGCDEVCTTPLPVTSWRLPWMHTLFENAAAEISGVEAGLEAMMRKGKVPKRDIKYVAMAGDGGTSDIGLQALSGAIERGHNFLYVCWDNEAYMVETGVFPLYEVDNGHYKLNVDRPSLRPVEEYLKPQGRFRHLSPKEIEKIQERVNEEYAKLKAKVAASSAA